MTSGNCKECGEFTESLVGLFVPYACKECLEKIRKDQIAKKKICLLCKEPYCDCTC